MVQQPHIMTAQVLDRFCVAGINYHAADAHLRGTFSPGKESIQQILEQARELQLRSVFVITTCNRTEIYGFAESVMQLAQLLTQHTTGNLEQFLSVAYLKNGQEALNHLYKVAAGIDSQILGDYEILGQLKQAVDFSASHGMIGPIMHRTLNFVFQASKKIKTTTSLSTGTVSVSYAAIELLKNIPQIHQQKVLVIGAGKFGSNVCRNLQQYLPRTEVKVINRTDDKASALAEKLSISAGVYGDLGMYIEAADVIIVCTNADEPTVLASHFTSTDQKLILDLSVPVNVAEEVKSLPGIRVIDVDEISTTILDKTLSRRKAELPKALEIIDGFINEFLNWLNDYRYSLYIKSWKDKLQELEGTGACFDLAQTPLLTDDRRVQKAVSRLAVNLRSNQEKGCQFITAINDYLQMS